MALNAAVIMPPLQQVIFDKTLDTFLSDGTVYFFEDSNRTVPKNVYELTGTGPGSYTYTSLGAVLTLSGIGSFVDFSGNNIAIYLWPFTGSPNDNPPSQTVQNYYITVYSSTGVFQFDIPNWPGVTANESPINTADTTDNIISNGQFVEVDFLQSATRLNPFVISTTGTATKTDIAPGWFIQTTGTGNFSVYQQQILDNAAPGNPAFALGIASSTGYTQPLLLVQSLSAPRIFAGQYVSGTFIVESTNGSINTFSMSYVPSLTGVAQVICSGNTTISGFTVIANTTPVLISNPGSGAGTVTIVISIPIGAQVQISCIQLCAVGGNQEVVDYLQEPPERERDHLFHYYEPLLKYKPIKSFLCGWDFPLNPRQFFPGGTQTITSGTPTYVFDQTIMDCSSSTVGATSIATTGTLSVTTSANNQAFYILQYLTGNEAIITTRDNLSININAYSLSGSNVIASAFLYYSTGGGSIPSLSLGSTIGTVSADGTFNLTASGWSKIPQGLGFANSGTLLLSSLQDIPLSGWNSSATNFGQAITNNFAIVITFSVPTSGTQVIINSVSCVPGNIATPPAPQTSSEVRLCCQYYYNSSFLPGTPPGQNVGANTGESYGVQTIAGATTNIGPIVEYATPMIVSPTVILYSPISLSANIANLTGSSNWSSSTFTKFSANGFATIGTGAVGSAVGDLSGVHWASLARLGVQVL